MSNEVSVGKLLRFLAERLVVKYRESPNTDYILRALEIGGKFDLKELEEAYKMASTDCDTMYCHYMILRDRKDSLSKSIAELKKDRMDAMVDKEDA